MQGSTERRAGRGSGVIYNSLVAAHTHKLTGRVRLRWCSSAARMTAESMRMRIDTIAGGSLDDTRTSSHPATAVENGVFYSLLMLQTRGWLCNSWTERFVVLADGQLHLYASADADAPVVEAAALKSTSIVAASCCLASAACVRICRRVPST